MTAAVAHPQTFVARKGPAPKFETPRPAAPVTQTAPVDERAFEDLRRDAPDLGATGVHPTAVVILISAYGLMLASFWLFFGNGQTALTLAVVTILALMFFGLLGGGILLADSLPKGQQGRSFAEFLDGRVLIATGWISGREAFAQIAFLPALLLVGGVVFGAIWRLVAR